jgi:putative membrane protein
MIHALVSFLTYLVTSVVLLAGFIWVYEKFTPYREFALIKENNCAAAVTLGGALLGFTFPLVSSIYYTQSLIEMVLWALITGVVQLVVFLALRRWSVQVEKGQVAPALFMAAVSIAVGLLNAVSISH